MLQPCSAGKRYRASTIARNHPGELDLAAGKSYNAAAERKSWSICSVENFRPASSIKRLLHALRRTARQLATDLMMFALKFQMCPVALASPT